MRNISIAVACVNASGMADLPVFQVQCTEQEYDLGVHYEKAEAMAEAAGYEGPFICFDPAEHTAIPQAAKTLSS